MENAGDWLYVVFLAIAVASSFFGSKKTKKRPSEVLGHPDEEAVTKRETAKDKGFWEILEEMQEKTSQTEKHVEKERRKQKQPVAAPAANPFLTYEKSIPDSIAEQVPMKAFAFEEENSLLDGCDLHDPAELKKAIIYAEIFNRKY